jgi:hypothetical protein
MSVEAEYRFVFRGSALAAGGRIRRPDLVLPSQASAHVGVSGGYLRVESSGANFNDIVRYSAAESEVRADYQNPAAAVKYTHGNHSQNRLPTRTTVRSTISDLAIVNADESTKRSVTCAKMSAEMVSEWPGTGGQTSLRNLKAAIRTLKFDDKELEVTFGTDIFLAHGTKGALKYAYESDGEFRQNNGQQFLHPAGHVGSGTRLPETGELTCTTIVRKLSWRGAPNPHARIDGHKVIFVDFGTVYLGELFISEFSRRLTLMRVELGSPCGGSMYTVEIEADGHGYPPY